MQEKPYEKLKFYQDICELRKSIVEITERFGNKYLRLVGQMRDSARSAKQNIREGYGRGSLSEFLRSIRISQGSLEELSGDVNDCLEDKLITPQEHEKLSKLCNSALYMSNQYVKSMNKSANRGKWKVSGDKKKRNLN